VLVSVKALNKPVKPFTSPPLILAILGGHQPVVEYLLSFPSIDINVHDEHMVGPRYLAIDSPVPVQMLEFLLDHERYKHFYPVDHMDGAGMTLLGQACHRGNAKIVSMLLARGADPKLSQMGGGVNAEIWDSLGESCLHLAAQSGNLECVKLMISSGLTPDILDCSDRTPIFTATKYGHLNVIKYLVEVEHVDMNWVDMVGMTPRDYADSIGMYQIALFLARKGAKSELAQLKRPRGFVAKWTRLWVYGDTPSPRNQPEVVRFGKHVYISGGWEDSHEDEPLDLGECFRFCIDDIRPTTLKTLLEPKKRPYTLSTTLHSPYVHVQDNLQQLLTSSSPPSSSSSVASSSGVIADSQAGVLLDSLRVCKVTCTVPSNLTARANSILFDKPFTPTKGSIAYFEVKIERLVDSGVVAIGLVPKDFRFDQNLPGWTRHSYAYHSDDGTAFTRCEPIQWGPAALEGDTLGIGVHWDHRSVFYTHNGVFLGTVPVKDIGKRPLYGCVGLIGNGTSAIVNFGVDWRVHAQSSSVRSASASASPPAATLPPPSSLTKTGWMYNFEVMAVKCERVVPTIAPLSGSLVERQVVLLFEFPRLLVPIGPYLASVGMIESFTFFFDTRTNKLFKMNYASQSPFHNGVDLLQIALVGHRIFCMDTIPPMQFTSEAPTYELSEPLEGISFSIFDLKTSLWSQASIDLRHFKPKPIIDIATAHVPYIDGKLWFFSSPNNPFYIDVAKMRAYPIMPPISASSSLFMASRQSSHETSPNGKGKLINMWESGAAFAAIPCDSVVSHEIELLTSPTSMSSSTMSDWSKDSEVKALVEELEKNLEPWDGHSDMREELVHLQGHHNRQPQQPEQQQQRPLQRIVTIDTWNSKMAKTELEESEEEEDVVVVAQQPHKQHHDGVRSLEMQDVATGGAKEDLSDQLLVFGGLFKVSKDAATRHQQQRNSEEERPSEGYTSGQMILSANTAIFHPKTSAWSVPRIQGFTPTPKGQSGMVYIGGGRVVNFGGAGLSQEGLPLELEMISLSSSFSTDDKLSRFFNNPLFSDFEIGFPNTTTTATSSIHVHKAVLASRCKFFHALLSAELSSSSSSSSSVSSLPKTLQRYDVPLEQANYFRQIVQYLYSDTVPQDLEPQDFCGFLDTVELVCPEHLPRLGEILFLNNLTPSSKSIVKEMGMLLQEDDPLSLSLTDAQVVAEGKFIPCHRVILCSRSDYFKALFSGSMIEGKMGVAEIAGIPYGVCLEIIRYLYTLEVNYDGLEEIIVDMLIWSAGLSITDLYTAIESLVISNLSLENVDYLLEVSQAHHLARLELECARLKEAPVQMTQVQQEDLVMKAPEPKRKKFIEHNHLLEHLDFEAAARGEYDAQPDDPDSVRAAKEVMRSFLGFVLEAATMRNDALYGPMEDGDPEQGGVGGVGEGGAGVGVGGHQQAHMGGRQHQQQQPQQQPQQQQQQQQQRPPLREQPPRAFQVENDRMHVDPEFAAQLQAQFNAAWGEHQQQQRQLRRRHRRAAENGDDEEEAEDDDHEEAAGLLTDDHEPAEHPDEESDNLQLSTPSARQKRKEKHE